MEPTVAIDIGREALFITLVISGPILIVSLVVGMVIGIFQAVTQIHEMTLTFVPKLLAMFGLFIVLLPWMTMKLVDYTVTLFGQIHSIVR